MIPENIIISRTDSIGDVVLTLPMAKTLKDKYPACKIVFLGKEYTRPVIRACKYVDQFLSLNDFMNKEVVINGRPPQCIIHVFPHKAIAKRARQLKIPTRIGTTNRLFHWTTCNKLVKLSRKKSDLHESQLNIKLLAPLGIKELLPLSVLQHSFGLERIQPIGPSFSSLLKREKYNLILHPKSQGNGREWGLANFEKLIDMLDPGRFNIFVSGTEAERALMIPLMDKVKDKITDLTGRMDLHQFIAFINRCDGLLASGTGPLHIAAALGRDAFGIFPPIRPIHPGRWAPLGEGAKVFVSATDCSDCRKSPKACHCIAEIQPSEILQVLEERYGRLMSNPRF